MAEAAAQLGGNLRVGLEDNIFLEKACSLLAQRRSSKSAAALCRAAGRAIATPEEARALLLKKPLRCNRSGPDCRGIPHGGLHRPWHRLRGAVSASFSPLPSWCVCMSPKDLASALIRVFCSRSSH